jgi:hypothetical protein
VAKTEAVAKTAAKEVLTLDPELALALMQEEQGTGLEGATVKDMAIPFLNIIQAMSPQKNKRDPKYIEGAEEGMIFNTVTGELFNGETGVVVIPCFFQKTVNEWAKNRGGFLGSYPTQGVADQNRRRGEDQSDLVDTANHFVLLKNNDDEWTQACLSMTSTKLKVSRNWMSRMQMLKVPTKTGKRTPPTFMTQYLITTVHVKNTKGEFFNYQVDYVGLVPDRESFEAAKEFYEVMNSGEGRDRVDYNQEVGGSGPTPQDTDEPQY